MMSIGYAISSHILGRQRGPDTSDPGLFNRRRVEDIPVEQQMSNNTTVGPQKEQSQRHQNTLPALACSTDRNAPEEKAPVISNKIDRWVLAQVDRIVTDICKPDKTYEEIRDDLQSISLSHDMSLIKQYIMVPSEYCECSAAIFEYLPSLLHTVARDWEHRQKAQKGQTINDGSCCVSAGKKICGPDDDKIKRLLGHLVRLKTGGGEEWELRNLDVVNDKEKLGALTVKYWEECGNDNDSLKDNLYMAKVAIRSRHRTLRYSARVWDVTKLTYT